MRLPGTRLDAEMLQQLVADDMRWLIEGAANSNIDIGFAEVNGIKLGMAVGKMHKADIAKFFLLVNIGRVGRCPGRSGDPADCAGYSK